MVTTQTSEIEEVTQAASEDEPEIIFKCRKSQQKGWAKCISFNIPLGQQFCLFLLHFSYLPSISSYFLCVYKLLLWY